MYQGCSSDQIKNLENALTESKGKRQELQESIRAKNN